MKQKVFPFIINLITDIKLNKKKKQMSSDSSNKKAIIYRHKGA